MEEIKQFKCSELIRYIRWFKSFESKFEKYRPISSHISALSDYIIEYKKDYKHYLLSADKIDTVEVALQRIKEELEAFTINIEIAAKNIYKKISAELEAIRKEYKNNGTEESYKYLQEILIPVQSAYGNISNPDDLKPDLKKAVNQIDSLKKAFGLIEYDFIGASLNKPIVNIGKKDIEKIHSAISDVIIESIPLHLFEQVLIAPNTKIRLVMKTSKADISRFIKFLHVKFGIEEYSQVPLAKFGKVFIDKNRDGLGTLDSLCFKSSQSPVFKILKEIPDRKSSN